MLTQQRRRVRVVLDTEDEVTTDFLEALWKEATRCEVCRMALGEKRHLDHRLPIAFGGGHTRQYVRFVHEACNVRRPRDGRDVL